MARQRANPGTRYRGAVVVGVVEVLPYPLPKGLFARMLTMSGILALHIAQ